MAAFKSKQEERRDSKRMKQQLAGNRMKELQEKHEADGNSKLARTRTRSKQRRLLANRKREKTKRRHGRVTCYRKNK